MPWQPATDKTAGSAVVDGAGVTDPNASALDLLRQAMGVELSVFAPSRADLCETCRTCCTRGEKGFDVAHGCAVVRALAAGEDLPAEACPSVCDAGHAIRLQPGDSTDTRVLMVTPRRDADADVEEVFDRRLPAIAALWERCESLAQESEGLAVEIIRSYEQLNVIFDITQEICKTRDAAQIKLFLVRRLAQTLGCDWSCCLSSTEGVLWWGDENARSRDEAVAHVRAQHNEQLTEVTAQRTPVVFNAPPVNPEQWPSLLFGPLAEAEGRTDVLVFARRPDQPSFIYGDVMMIDSVLSHAQNVITNLRLIERLRTMSLGAVRALVSAIDKKDHYTSGHSERVGFLSRLIGEHYGLSPEQLQDLEWGGLLHDVGKIGISDVVLSKPGGLTAEEFDHIKQHVWMSYEIVAPIECMASVRDIVLYHHEVPDGTGYPKGLKQEETPLMAQIVHVADTFDALTTSRSYRRAFPFEKALAIMKKEKGVKLNAELVDHFEAAIAKYRAAQPDQFGHMFAHLEEGDAS